MAHPPVHLADFLAAVGDLPRPEVERICPFPALLELGPDAPRCEGALRTGDPAPQRAALRTSRLRAALSRGSELSLRFLAPEAPGAGVTVGHARFTDLRGAWHVEDVLAPGATGLEGEDIRAGAAHPLTGGQELRLGERRALFLGPSDLHLLLCLANEAETRIVLPPAGVLLSDLRRLIRSPNAPGPTSPPFLLEVPVEGPGEAPGSFATMLVDPEEMNLPRAPGDHARIHSIVARGDPAKGEVVAGRADDCDLLLSESSVSKHHVRFQLQQGEWKVVDLGSQNGTSVRGERVPAHLIVPLRSGDQLQLGTYRCVFLLPEGVGKMLGFLTARLRGGR